MKLILRESIVSCMMSDKLSKTNVQQAERPNTQTAVGLDYLANDHASLLSLVHIS